MNEFYTSVSRYGNSLLYRGYSSEGEAILKRVKYRPSLYVPDKDPSSKWTSLFGTPLRKLQMNSMKETTEFIKQYSNVPEFEICGNVRFPHAFIQEKFPRDITYDKDFINVVNFDIETAVGNEFPNPEHADQEIRAITAHRSRDNTYYTWGLKKEHNPKENYVYEYCHSEENLLRRFLNWWTNDYPDIITGWNIRFFDTPYLVNRIVQILGEDEAKTVSPWKLIRQEEIYVQGRRQVAYNITGVKELDYIELFKKFALLSYGNQESYSLNHISHVVLGEKKIDFSDVGNINDVFEKDHKKFVDYNRKDVELVHRIDEKMGLIDVVLAIAYLSGINYEDTLKTTPAWESLIHRQLIREKVVVPAHGKQSTKTAFAGGYVKSPLLGMHDWVMSFDVTSLYPSIIMQYNISPETILQNLDFDAKVETFIDGTFTRKDKNVAVTANGAQFNISNEGHIPHIVKKIFDMRITAKKKMISLKNKAQKDKVTTFDSEITRYHNLQLATKTLLNSLFGAYGNQYFKFFDIRIAEAITLTGQSIIQHAEKVINNRLNHILKTNDIDRVCAIDTDSCMVDFSDLVSRFKPKDPISFLDGVAKKDIGPVLTKAFSDFAERTGSYEKRIVFNRENICDKTVFTAKKRYIMNVLDSEGIRYDTPKLKIMGIEAIKSSTPQICRDKMKEMFPIIMTKTEADVQHEIFEFRKHFSSCAPHFIGSPRTANDIIKWANKQSVYKKGTPMHVRGSLLYNQQIKSKKLDNRYRLIHNGDKIKYVYLKTPNPIRENIIAFPDDHLPVQLGLHDFIDYDLQYEKTFVDPLQIVLESIGWSANPASNLDSFFS